MLKQPDFLFRYRSLAEGADNFVKRTLLDDELFFAAPASFNDLFDCCPAFDFTATTSEMVNFYKRVLRRLLPNASEIELIQEALAKVHDPQRSLLRKEMQEEVHMLHGKHVSGKIGVLCLSAICDEILMWSHYANFHRGICLRFDAKHPYFANKHEVDYLELRPRINPFKDDTDRKMDAALLAKAMQWKYEQEWRLFNYQVGPGVRKFPPEALSGIVLGARISSKDEEKIMAWIRARNVSTKLFRAVQSLTGYSLTIEIV